MLREPVRTPYKVQFFSSSSDLMKSTVVDKSLSSNETSSVPEKTTLLLQETTE